MLADDTSTHVSVSTPKGAGTLFQRLRTPSASLRDGFPDDARSGRVLVAYRPNVPMGEHQVTSRLLGCNSYTCDFVSQNKCITDSLTWQDTIILPEPKTAIFAPRTRAEGESGFMLGCAINYSSSSSSKRTSSKSTSRPAARFEAIRSSFDRI